MNSIYKGLISGLVIFLILQLLFYGYDLFSSDSILVGECLACGLTIVIGLLVFTVNQSHVIDESSMVEEFSS